MTEQIRRRKSDHRSEEREVIFNIDLSSKSFYFWIESKVVFNLI